MFSILAGPLSLNYGYLPFPCYRRMTPGEDLLATQQGIDLLVKQRQTLVDQLVKHHNQLARTNEKETLLQFSRQIDTIMRYEFFYIRGHNHLYWNVKSRLIIK